MRAHAFGEPLRVKLSAGPHKVELAASGRKTFTGDVEVPWGQELPVHGRLSFSPPRSLALLSGVLGVGAGVGGWALLAQPSYKLSGFGTNKLPIVEPTGTQPYFKIGGGVALGVAGLLAAATVYQLVSDPTPASRVQLGKPRDFAQDEPPREAAPPRKRLFDGKETAARDRCGGAL